MNGQQADNLLDQFDQKFGQITGLHTILSIYSDQQRVHTSISTNDVVWLANTLQTWHSSYYTRDKRLLQFLKDGKNALDILSSELGYKGQLLLVMATEPRNVRFAHTAVDEEVLLDLMDGILQTTSEYASQEITQRHSQLSKQ